MWFPKEFRIFVIDVKWACPVEAKCAEGLLLFWKWASSIGCPLPTVRAAHCALIEPSCPSWNGALKRPFGGHGFHTTTSRRYSVDVGSPQNLAYWALRQNFSMSRNYTRTVPGQLPFGVLYKFGLFMKKNFIFFCQYCNYDLKSDPFSRNTPKIFICMKRNELSLT